MKKQILIMLVILMLFVSGCSRLFGGGRPALGAGGSTVFPGMDWVNTIFPAIEVTSEKSQDIKTDAGLIKDVRVPTPAIPFVPTPGVKGPRYYEKEQRVKKLADALTHAKDYILKMLVLPLLVSPL